MRMGRVHGACTAQWSKKNDDKLENGYIHEFGFRQMYANSMQKICKKDTVMHCTIIYTWTMPDMVKYSVALWHLALG